MDVIQDTGLFLMLKMF